MSSSCKEKAQCKDCSHLHPTLLHITKSSTENSAKGNDEQLSVSSALVQTTEAFGSTGAGKENCILSIISVCVKSQKGTKAVTTYASINPGSSVTFVTGSLTNQLHLKGHNTCISMRTLGNEYVLNTRVVMVLVWKSAAWMATSTLNSWKSIHRKPFLLVQIIFPVRKILTSGPI